jgi:drug/metabolite transporter (DMT)-like permease
MVAGRVVIASLVLVAFMRANGVALPRAIRDWIPMLVLAIFGNLLPFQLVAWAQQYIASSTAGVLMAVMPLFVLSLAHFFVPGSRLTLFRVFGFIAGFVGVVLVIGIDSISNLLGNTALLGCLAVLAAAFSYSVNSIYARRLGQANPIRLAAGMMIVSCMFAVPRATPDLAELAAPSFGAALALVFLGLLSTGAATILYFRVIQGPGPTFLSLVNYLVPVWAAGTGAFFLGETLPLSIWAGLALILSGIAIGEFGPRLRRALPLPMTSRPLIEDA